MSRFSAFFAREVERPGPVVRAVIEEGVRQFTGVLSDGEALALVGAMLDEDFDSGKIERLRRALSGGRCVTPAQASVIERALTFKNSRREARDLMGVP